MRDEELRALERAAKTGDHAARLKLADLRARTVPVSVLDDFICGRAAKLVPNEFTSDIREPLVSELDRRAVFFIANAANALADQRRRVPTWATSVCYGRMVALIVVTHGLVIFGIAEGAKVGIYWRGEPHVHYSPRRAPSWGFVHDAWKEIPKRRPSASDGRAALEGWALARVNDRLAVTAGVAGEWATFARERYGNDSEEEGQDEESGLEDDVDGCMCEFGDCGGTRYLHICGGDGGECLGCEDCRHEEADDEDDGWYPRDEEDRLAGLPDPIPADQPEQRPGGPS